MVLECFAKSLWDTNIFCHILCGTQFFWEYEDSILDNLIGHSLQIPLFDVFKLHVECN